MTIACGEATATVEGQYGGGAVPIKCKRWSCDFCQPIRRASVIRQILNGNPNRMLTLTHRSRPGDTPESLARKIAAVFPRFIKLCRKKCGGEELAYFVVFEAHEGGNPHLHIALRSPFLAQRWLKRVWYRLTRSFIVDIRAIGKVNRTAGYMSKYLGKDLHKFGTLKRYWQSANYQGEDDKAFERTFPVTWQWQRLEEKPSWIKQRWIKAGRLVRDLPHGAFAYGVLTDDVRDVWAIVDGPLGTWRGS